MKFQVINGKQKPILSAQTCQTLQLLKISEQIHEISETGTGNKPLTKESILKEFHDVFEGLGNIGDASVTVDPDAKPIQHAPRRIAVTLHQEIKAKLAELEKKQIIVKETEPTEWISNMVVVAKPGKIRICLDPKDLSKAIRRPKYQVPTLDETLPKLGNAKVFTTLDAKDGFYQINLTTTAANYPRSGRHLADIDIYACHLVFFVPQKSSKVLYTNNWEILKAWRYFATICWGLVMVIPKTKPTRTTVKIYFVY